MGITQIVAEHVIPGIVFNFWVLLAIDIMTERKLQALAGNNAITDWLGNILFLVFIAISYFTGVLVSSLRLELNRKRRQETTDKVRGLKEIIKKKKEILIRQGIYINGEKLYETYRKLYSFVVKNADEYVQSQIQRDQNYLALERAMVIPLILHSITMPFWLYSFTNLYVCVMIGLILLLIAWFTSMLEWKRGEKLSERVVLYAWQYLTDIEDNILTQKAIIKKRKYSSL